jgi:two-component system phosphate regulon sensor histidine kinase PhoR
LAALSFLSFLHLASVQPAWGLFFGAVVLTIAGMQVQNGLKQATDLVAHRQSQSELLQAQLEEQRNAVDSMADGLEIAIFICDARATILYANRRAIELFRFERPVGRNVLAVTLSYDLEQLVITGGKTGTPQHAEISFTYPDERVGSARVWCSEEAGNRVFLSVYEITDLRRLERIRQDFVANVSHELRTPMTIIRSMAETLVDDELAMSERSVKYLNKIISEVDRLSMISQDLLILSAAESNPVRKQMCDIAEVFRSTVQQLEPKAHEKELELTFDGPVRCIVEANTSQMTQVALNLIDNAIKYTTTGEITVSLQEFESKVRIFVADTGIGIPSDQIKRVFERFYRVDRARSRATGGTGLGLSIVKHIVEAHGGAVTVESALNHGSTFTVELPTGG